MWMCLTESVRSYYNLIIKKAGQFLTDLQVNLLKFALALKFYSPAVHAFQQVCYDQNCVKSGILALSHMQPGNICVCRRATSISLLEDFTFSVAVW